MKLLIITQTIDPENTTLGFFIDWVIELSKRFEEVKVICLYKNNNFNFNSKNIEIFSLGKEKNNSFLKKIFIFFKYIFLLRKKYDKVFVHMNQEYIVLGGLFWKIFNKKIFFWRNHPIGNLFTDVSIFFASKIFCTSNDAYVYKSKKTVLMPVGISNIFKDYKQRSGDNISLLMLGRISPIKRIEAGLELLSRAIASGYDLRLNIVGDFLSKDRVYYSMLKSYVSSAKINEFVSFSEGVDFKDTVNVYNKNHIFLNFTRTGSFDKTIIEALSSGCKVLTTNSSLKDKLPDYSYCQDDSESRFTALKKLLAFSKEESLCYNDQSLEISKYHSLSNLILNLSLCINQKK